MSLPFERCLESPTSVNCSWVLAALFPLSLRRCALMPSFKRNRLGRNASVPAMLTLANEALRKGVAGLKQLEDLSDFLGGMLKAAAHIAAAQTGWIVLLDADAVTCRFAAVMNRDGELLSQSDGLFRPTSITPELTAWMTALSRGANAWPLSPNNSLHSPEHKGGYSNRRC